MATIRIVDETTAGGKTAGPELEIDEPLRLRDLIALRVREEVRQFNRERPSRFYGLVQPTDLEAMLNGPSHRGFRPIDADTQVNVALEAFDRQAYLVLLPSKQATDLDEIVELGDGDEVSFLRLVPLVGG